MENLEIENPLSPREKINKDFERIKGKIAGFPDGFIKYKDSKGEKIFITKDDNRISIHKAQDPNKNIREAPARQNIKSSYTLIRNSKGSFSLETKTYTNNRGFSHEKSSKKIDNLDLGQISNSLKVFESRINEANRITQNEKDKQYRKMQQYAYNQEIQDKFDADILFQENGLA